MYKTSVIIGKQGGVRVAKATRTIYKVEGLAAGESPPEPSRSSGDFLEPAAVGVHERTASTRFSRRRLFWILVGVAVLTVAMIVAIAVLGAAESPAAGTSMGTSASSTPAAAVGASEPAGTSTTLFLPTSSTSS
jgi:hypothetical protein